MKKMLILSFVFCFTLFSNTSSAQSENEKLFKLLGAENWKELEAYLDENAKSYKITSGPQYGEYEKKVMLGSRCLMSLEDMKREKKTIEDKILWDFNRCTKMTSSKFAHCLAGIRISKVMCGREELTPICDQNCVKEAETGKLNSESLSVSYINEATVKELTDGLVNVVNEKSPKTENQNPNATRDKFCKEAGLKFVVLGAAKAIQKIDNSTFISPGGAPLAYICNDAKKQAANLLYVDYIAVKGLPKNTQQGTCKVTYLSFSGKRKFTNQQGFTDEIPVWSAISANKLKQLMPNYPGKIEAPTGKCN